MPADYTPPPELHAVAVPAQQHHRGERADHRAWGSYVVRPGDSLAKIAVRYRTTIAALVAKNGLDDPRRLEIGRTLTVPGAAPVRSSAAAATTPGSAAAPRPAAAPSSAAVQRSAFAARVPQGATRAAKAERPAARTVLTHRVQPGDSVHGLAARYDASPGAILKANRMSGPEALKAGAQVRIPVATGADRSSRDGRSAPAQPGPSTFEGRTYPADVVAAADRNRGVLRHAPVPTRSETRALIVRTAQQYGVNPRLALAVAWQESGWNQRAVSPANAVGVMQVLPSTGTWASQLTGRELDLRSAQDNVTAGVVVLRWLTTHAQGLDQAIAGYYQGLAGVQQDGMYPDTLQYVTAVKAHVARF